MTYITAKFGSRVALPVNRPKPRRFTLADMLADAEACNAKLHRCRGGDPEPRVSDYTPRPQGGMSIKASIVNLLAGGEMTIAQIVGIVGARRRTVASYLRKNRNAGVFERRVVDGKTLWRLV